MRIVHYLKRVQPEAGGVVRAALDLCAVLASGGHEITLVTFDGAGVPEAWRDGRPDAPSVTVVPPPARPGQRFSRRQLRAIEPILEASDVVHLHAVWTPSNVQIAAAAARLGRPYVMSVHGMLDDWSMSVSPLKKRLFLAVGAGRMLRRARLLHFSCREEMRQSLRRLPHPHPVVIPFAFEGEAFGALPGPELARKALGLSDGGRPLVLFLSRLHPVKGIELLIEAVGRLKTEGVGADLLVAGPGPETYLAELRRCAERCGVAERVRFEGFIDGPAKVSLYQAATLFCLPSLHENFGLVWAESLAAGTPVITTRGVGVWADLEESGAALIVPRTAGDLADAIRALLEDEARREQMAARCRPWILEFLDESRIRDALVSMYSIASATGASEAGSAGTKAAEL